jgi:hypothetical protein
VVAFTYVPAASGVVEEFNIWTNPNLTWEEKIQVNKSQIIIIHFFICLLTNMKTEIVHLRVIAMPFMKCLFQ